MSSELKTIQMELNFWKVKEIVLICFAIMPLLVFLYYVSVGYPDKDPSTSGSISFLLFCGFSMWVYRTHSDNVRKNVDRVKKYVLERIHFLGYESSMNYVETLISETENTQISSAILNILAWLSTGTVTIMGE